MHRSIIYPVLIISFFTLTALKCGTDDQDGHEFITIKNNSDHPIYLIDRWQRNISPTDTFFACNSAGQWRMDKGESIKAKSKNPTWEKDLSVIPFIQFFILTEDYKASYCDNNIEELTKKYQLKRYLLQTEDLEEMNWTINYP